MTLVNKADADRDTVEDYMRELEHLHETQLALMSTLEDVSHVLSSPPILLAYCLTRQFCLLLVLYQCLNDYCEFRNAAGGTSPTQHATAFGILSDDDSFEDLRD